MERLVLISFGVLFLIAMTYCCNQDGGGQVERILVNGTIGFSGGRIQPQDPRTGTGVPPENGGTSSLRRRREVKPVENENEHGGEKSGKTGQSKISIHGETKAKMFVEGKISKNVTDSKDTAGKSAEKSSESNRGDGENLHGVTAGVHKSFVFASSAAKTVESAGGASAQTPKYAEHGLDSGLKSGKKTSDLAGAVAQEASAKVAHNVELASSSVGKSDGSAIPHWGIGEGSSALASHVEYAGGLLSKHPGFVFPSGGKSGSVEATRGRAAGSYQKETTGNNAENVIEPAHAGAKFPEVLASIGGKSDKVGSGGKPPKTTSDDHSARAEASMVLKKEIAVKTTKQS